MLDKKIMQYHGKIITKNVARGVCFILGIIGLGIGDPIQAIKRMVHSDFDELQDKEVIIYLIDRNTKPIEGFIKIVKKGYVMVKGYENKIIYVNTDRIDYIKTKPDKQEDT